MAAMPQWNRSTASRSAKESVLALQLVEKLPTDIYKFVVSLRSPDRHEDEQTAIIAGIHAVSISLCRRWSNRKAPQRNAAAV